jgi:hypothetical protein
LQYSNDCYPLASQISIIDNKGTKYTFGGTLGSLEYSIYCKSISSALNDNPSPKINSLHLRKIEYSNGQVVDFNYKAISNQAENNACRRVALGFEGNAVKGFYTLNRTFSEIRENSSVVNCVGFLCSSASSSSGSFEISNEIQKRVILESIVGSNFQVNFNYTTLPYKFYLNPSINAGFNPYDISLAKIEIKDKASPTPYIIKQIDFDYEDAGGTYKRRFLKNVQINSIQKYQFEYYNNSNLPDPETKGIDYWGFWNGKDTNQYLIPSTSNNLLTGDYQYTTEIREPDLTKYNIGVLSKIIYPTKGYSEFIYEPHSYSKKLDRVSNSQFLTTLINSSGYCGGARIKQINNFDGLNFEYKEYKYFKDYNPLSISHISSGILMSYPRYFMAFHSSASGYPTVTKSKSQSNSFSAHSLEGSAITYGEVIEIKKDKDNNILGYTIKKYNDYSNTPDIDDKNYRFPLAYASQYNPINLHLNYAGIMYNDRSSERGKLYNEKIYDKNFNKQIEKKFTYNIDDNRFNSYVTNIYTSGPASNANKLYFYPFYLTKTEEVNYTQGNITNSSTYVYGLNNNISFQSTLFADGSSNNTNFKYAFEKGNTYLLSKNIISIPLETEITKAINGVTETISKTLTNYPVSQIEADTITMGLPLPYDAWSKNLQTTTMEKQITYGIYDTKGNLLQYTTKSGVPTAIIWGYNQTQPIAKIEGATYAQVSSLATALVTSSNADIDATTEQNFITALDTFRKDSTMSGYQITTYTYDPLIGVTTITSPSGIREYYIYDTANRLQSVKDINGNVLKEYQYHYKP